MTRSVSAARIADLLRVRSAGSGPAYQELAEALRRLIADGRVPPGVRLPSERELTDVLEVSRTTVTRAYDVLRERRYLESRQGSGSVARLPDGQRSRRSGALTPGTGDPEAIDLTCAALSAPPGFLGAAEAAVAALPAHLAARGYHPLGLAPLRAAIADRFSARGLPTDADQIMITSGALSGVSAALRALATTGDRVLLESPTYPNAIETVRSLGARPVAMPLDPSGWDSGTFVATLRQTAPRAAYLIPDFHNPTGALMPSAQRQELGRALRSTHTVPVIDETLVDLDLELSDVRAEQAGDDQARDDRTGDDQTRDDHAHDDQVGDDRGSGETPMAAFHPQAITVGGASKTFWGGLRIGWIRAPRDLFGAIADARLTFDLSASLFDQLLLLELLERRRALLRERRAAVRASRAALTQALANSLPQWRFRVPRGGLSLWIELPEPRAFALVEAAEQQGVIITSGSQFAVEGTMERFLRIPYGDVDPGQLEAVAGELAIAWDRALEAPAGARRRARVVA